MSEIQRICKMGRACRICDRKFFLRASFQGHAAQIAYYANESQAVEDNLNEIQLELDEINDQKIEIDAMIREEEQRYQSADEAQRQKLELI